MGVTTKPGSEPDAKDSKSRGGEPSSDSFSRMMGRYWDAAKNTRDGKPKSGEERKRILDDFFKGERKRTDLINLIKLKKAGRALEEVEELLKVTPDDFDLLLIRGVALAELGRLGSAVASAEKAIAIEPDNHRGHFMLGGLLGQGIDMVRARSELETAVRIKPNDPTYLAELASFIEKTDPGSQKARDIISQARQIDPEDVSIKGLYCAIFSTDNQTIMDEVLKDDPNDVQSLNLIGYNLLNEGRPVKAMDYFRKGLSLAPDNQVLRANYVLAAGHSFWFYKPKLPLIRWRNRLSGWVFYPAWIGGGILLVFVAQPLFTLFVAYNLYSWLVEPVAAFAADMKVKREREAH